jgi:hypothetical protein
LSITRNERFILGPEVRFQNFQHVWSGDILRPVLGVRSGVVMSTETTTLGATLQGAKIPACLALTVCPNCGYSLEGLPERGMCPECGREYAPGEIILYGYGCGTYENVMTTRPSRLWWLWSGAASGIFIQSAAFFSELGKYGLILVGVLGAIPPTCLYWRRKHVGHPAPVQVRIGPAGCVQYTDLAPPSPLDALLSSNFWVISVFTFGIATFAFWEKFPAWFFLVIGLLPATITFMAWRGGRRYRRAVRNAPENAIADVNALVIETTPWERVFEFEVIKHTRRRIHRLTVKVNGAMGAVAVVDVELNCTDEQATALVQAVQPWWRGSREPGVVAEKSRDIAIMTKP